MQFVTNLLYYTQLLAPVLLIRTGTGTGTGTGSGASELGPAAAAVSGPLQFN